MTISLLKQPIARPRSGQDIVEESFFQRERQKALEELLAWAGKQHRKYCFWQGLIRLTKKGFLPANIYLEEMND